MSIPNLLTLFRLLTGPIFAAVFIGTGKNGFLSETFSPQNGIILCTVILVLSEVSDVLDGILARKLNQVSDFGKLLDPYADSAFRMSCFLSYASGAHGDWVPLWMILPLFYRDMLVTVIRAFGIERRVFVHARASGKIKAVAQCAASIAILIAALVYGTDGLVATGLPRKVMWVALAVTMWSAADYFWANRHLFGDTSGKNPPGSSIGAGGE